MKILTKLAVICPTFILHSFINISFAVPKPLKDSSLVVVDYTANDGSVWNPAPVNVPVANSKSSTLSGNAPDVFDGTITYALADHCASKLDCDLNHVFTLSVDAYDKYCSLDKTELGIRGDLWKYYLIAHHQVVEHQVLCNVDVVAQYTPSIKVKITNYTAANGQGGTLAAGWVNTYDKTTCLADNPTDCMQAAQMEVAPSQTSSLYTFAADPDYNLLNATITYPITKDPALPEGSNVIIVTVQNGEEVVDRCQAEVYPPTPSHIVRYSVHTTQSGSDVDNICQVYVMREEPVD
jgi:hypothetical protein